MNYDFAQYLTADLIIHVTVANRHASLLTSCHSLFKNTSVTTFYYFPNSTPTKAPFTFYANLLTWENTLTSLQTESVTGQDTLTLYIDKQPTPGTKLQTPVNT